MTRTRWEQIGAAGGILFVALQLVGQALIQVGGMEPDFAAPATEIVAFFQARDTLLFDVGGFLSTLSTLAFVYFLAVLWARLHRHEGEPAWLSLSAFAAGLAAVAVILSSGGWGLAVFRIDEGLDPQLARYLFDDGNLAFATYWVALAGMLLATAVVVLRDGALPGWLGWLGVVAALLLLVARAFWASPSGLIFLPYVLFWIWLIGASTHLIRRASAP